MNTQNQRMKKGMKGISLILGVLLFTALFVSVGSAVSNGQTVFVYENVTGLEGTWNSGSNSITAMSDGSYGYFADTNFAEGQYQKGDLTITVLYPTATISGLATANSVQYLVIGGNLYKGDTVTFTATSASPNVNVEGFLVTYPNGLEVKNFGQTVSTPTNSITVSSSDLPLGEYQIRTIFSKDNFMSFVPANLLIAKSPSTFTLVDGKASITVETPTQTQPTPTETPEKPTPTVPPTEIEPTETEPIETQTETPTPHPTEAESPLPILGIITGLAAAAVLRRR